MWIRCNMIVHMRCDAWIPCRSLTIYLFYFHSHLIRSFVIHLAPECARVCVCRRMQSPALWHIGHEQFTCNLFVRVARLLFANCLNWKHLPHKTIHINNKVSLFSFSLMFDLWQWAEQQKIYINTWFSFECLCVSSFIQLCTNFNRKCQRRRTTTTKKQMKSFLFGKWVIGVLHLQLEINQWNWFVRSQRDFIRDWVGVQRLLWKALSNALNEMKIFILFRFHSRLKREDSTLYGSYNHWRNDYRTVLARKITWNNNNNKKKEKLANLCKSCACSMDRIWKVYSIMTTSFLNRVKSKTFWLDWCSRMWTIC